MNKAFYITGLALSVIFLIVCGYYILEVDNARTAMLFSSFENPNFYDYTDDGSSITEEAGLVSLIFFLLFFVIDLLGLIKVKTKTTKVLSIIGMSFLFLLILWDLLMISSPSHMSFDEVGVAFLLYCFPLMAFNIVGIVQAFKYAAKQKAA